MLMTVKEAAEKFSCSPKTIYLAIEHGELKVYRIRRNIRIDPKDLDEYASRDIRKEKAE